MTTINDSLAEPEFSEIEALKRKFRIPAFMPFFWLGLAGVAGPVLGQMVHLSWYWWGGLVLAGIISILIHRKDRIAIQTIRSVPVTLVLAALGITAMLYQLSLPTADPEHLLYYHQSGNINLTGVVVAPPEQKTSSLEVVVSAEKLALPGMPGHPVSGKVLFYVPLGTVISYGDRVDVWGELEKPDEGENFYWREYLGHQGIYSTIQYPNVKVIEHDQGNSLLAALYTLRESGSQVLTQIFPSPEDALLRGILLGDESAISPSMEEAYRRTGTSHIIAISGFNMAVLAGMIGLFFTRQLGTKRGAILTILALGAYSLLVGGSPSVLRAAFMGAYTVLAGSVARRGNTLNSLGLSALVMVLINPHLPWDLGFQFSFLATLGLALFAGPLQLRVEDWFKTRFEQKQAVVFASLISELVFLTLIAQAMVLPVSIWHFHQVSWLFLIANPLILPLQPAVMILGLTAMTAGLLSITLGRVVAWVAWLWAALTNWIVLTLSAIPTQPLSLPGFNFFWVCVYYLVLFALIFRPKIKEVGVTLLKPQYGLIALGALTVVTWLAVARAPDTNLHIYLPGEEKQAFLLIKGGEGQGILLAGSAGEHSLVEEISARLPLFTRRMEVVIIPQCKRDQLTGMFLVAEKYAIDQVLWLCDPESNQTSRNLFQALENKQVRQEFLTKNILIESKDLVLELTMYEELPAGMTLEHGEISLLILSPSSAEKLGVDSFGAIDTQNGAGFRVYPGCENCLAILGDNSDNNVRLNKDNSLELVSDRKSLSIR